MKTTPPFSFTCSPNMNIAIEYINLEALVAWPRNPKEHDLPGLQDSFSRFGFVQPIIIDTQINKIVAGHGRITALKNLKKENKPAPANIKIEGEAWHVPVIKGVVFANEKDAERYLLADNRLVEVGGWEQKMLTELLVAISKTEKQLAGVGFSAKELEDRLLADRQGTKAGVTPSEQLENYLHGETKQIVLYFTLTEYQDILTRLNVYMENHDLKLPKDVLVNLLEKEYASIGSQEATS